MGLLAILHFTVLIMLMSFLVLQQKFMADFTRETVEYKKKMDMFK